MPLAIDLFCGLGGWTEGLLAENWRVIGFDIERHEYWGPAIPESGGRKGTKPIAKRGWTQGCAVSLGLEGAAKRPDTQFYRYPAQLVVQDVLTLHGEQFKDADLIVASPPCTEYSWMAMPWSRAKQVARALRGEDEFPAGYKGSRTIKELNALFDACFRIQREACEAAGRHIPLVVENVRGAQPWVGQARWNFGSYHLWGDVPALMPVTVKAQKFNPDGTAHPPGSWSGVADSKNRGARSIENNGIKLPGNNGPTKWADRDIQRLCDATKNNGIKCGNDWFGSAEKCSEQRRHGSGSNKRKLASAMIAKIPPHLSRWIAAAWHPSRAA